MPAEFAELRGFLSAFEWVNHKADHGYTFSLDAIGDSDAALDQLAHTHFAVWEPTWLRSYLADPAPYRMTATTSFSLARVEFHPEFADYFMSRLECDGQISRGWSVSFKTDSFYECNWDDLLVHAGRWMVFLHFGVSD